MNNHFKGIHDMVTQETYISPVIRLLTVRFETAFCYSETKEGSYNGGPEDVGYDNWLDGLE